MTKKLHKKQIKFLKDFIDFTDLYGLTNDDIEFVRSDIRYRLGWSSFISNCKHRIKHKFYYIDNTPTSASDATNTVLNKLIRGETVELTSEAREIDIMYKRGKFDLMQ